MIPSPIPSFRGTSHSVTWRTPAIPEHNDEALGPGAARAAAKVRRDLFPVLRSLIQQQQQRLVLTLTLRIS